MIETASGRSLQKHPALRAWRRHSGSSALPQRIETLKDDSRSSVFRLVLGEDAECNVIAKRTRREKGLIEQQAYGWLDRLPLESVCCYGALADDDDARLMWLFVDDTGGCSFEPFNEDHQRLAAKWLGNLHVAVGDELPLDEAETRGPDFFHQHLRSIAANLPLWINAQLPPGGARILEAIAMLCRSLELKWIALEEYCREIPRTLTHGDCLPKNIHVDDRQGQDRVAFFDWGGAGIGLAGTDLGLLALPHRGPPSTEPDFTSYLDVVRTQWTTADLETTKQMALVGQLFWSLKVIDKSLPDFEYPSIHVIKNFRMYAQALWRSMAAASWSSLIQNDGSRATLTLENRAQIPEP